MQKSPQIALIGFGEAGKAFTQGWLSKQSCDIRAFDIKTLEVETRDKKYNEYQKYNVRGLDALKKVVLGEEFIFSLVTANKASAAAVSAAQYIQPKQYYFDCNSCSPNTKKANAEIIEKMGGYYIDVAVMSPVDLKLHKTPILISGTRDQEALAILNSLGMDVSVISGGVGQASVIKMIRSIMVKGLEALNAECLLAARKAGVESILFDSLSSIFPEYEEKSTYMLERMIQHGERRAEEMKEVSLTLNELRLPHELTDASVKWHQQIGEMALATDEHKFNNFADAILHKIKCKN